MKIHFSYGPQIPLRARAARAIYLLRDPIDVMMSVWDFKHLTGDEGLLDASPSDHAACFKNFASTGSAVAALSIHGRGAGGIMWHRG